MSVPLEGLPYLNGKDIDSQEGAWNRTDGLRMRQNCFLAYVDNYVGVRETY